MILETNIKVLVDMDKGRNRRQNIRLNLTNIQQLNQVIGERYKPSLKKSKCKLSTYDNNDLQLLQCRLIHRLQREIPVSQKHLQLLQDNDLILFDKQPNFGHQK